MNKIYIITGDRGSYSDRSNWNICAVHSKERAQELVDKLIRFEAFNNDFNERFNNEFHNSYLKDHLTELQQPILKKIAPSLEFKVALETHKIMKTDESKNNLKLLQAEHIKDCEEYNAEHSKKYKMYSAAVKIMNDAGEEWRKNNYSVPEDLKEVAALDSVDQHPGIEKTRYGYQEINIL
jgi:hypothetical protein